MAVPFTHEEFSSVFASYNAAVWPGHLLLFTLAVGATVLATAPGRRRSVAASGILAGFWAAIGSTAAFDLGVPQDLGLLAAGLLALLLLRPGKRAEEAAVEPVGAASSDRPAVTTEGSER